MVSRERFLRRLEEGFVEGRVLCATECALEVRRKDLRALARGNGGVAVAVAECWRISVLATEPPPDRRPELEALPPGPRRVEAGLSLQAGASEGLQLTLQDAADEAKSATELLSQDVRVVVVG